MATDELTLVRAAELYYEQNKTQDEIGALLRLTRWKVGRLLSQAREDGIVRIEIVHPKARRASVERELVARYGLRDAVVVPDSDDEDAVPRAAADFLAALRPVPRTLGVSWGRTLDRVAEALPEGWATGVDVVQVNGAVGGANAAATASTIAAKAAGSVTILPTPAIMERRETRLAIEADRTVSQVLDRAAAASGYLFSAGAAGPDSIHIASGYLSSADLDALVARGAVGDVLGRFIDADGHTVDGELDGRTVGIELDVLRGAAWAIAVIAGPAKRAVAHAVVTNRLCSVLVTDESTALSLLEKTE